MKIISSGRQTGKTTALVERVKGGVQRGDGTWSRVLIVATDREAQRIAREYHLDPRQILSNQSWDHGRGFRPEEIELDNLEDWLYSQLGTLPAYVTTTIPVEVVRLDTFQAAQAAVASALDAYGDTGLLEDEDGAPYPEPVQALAREMRLKMREVDGLLENLQTQLARTRNKAAHNEVGLLGMLASVVVPKDSRIVTDLDLG